jgi:uncharacterized cupin superfamily protein
MDRPTFIVSALEVPEVLGQYPGRNETFSYGRAIGEAAGLSTLGVHIERVLPGCRTSLPHAELTDEEFVFVLEGELDAWIDGDWFRIRRYDFVGFAAGTGICHTFVNRGKDDATLLVGGTKSGAHSRTYYPLNPERELEMPLGRFWQLKKR